MKKEALGNEKILWQMRVRSVPNKTAVKTIGANPLQ